MYSLYGQNNKSVDTNIYIESSFCGVLFHILIYSPFVLSFFLIIHTCLGSIFFKGLPINKYLLYFLVICIKMLQCSNCFALFSSKGVNYTRHMNEAHISYTIGSYSFKDRISAAFNTIW